MTRKASGTDCLEQAKAYLASAKTIQELRQAQAVILPLMWGLSIKNTAEMIGMSVGWTCQQRRSFIRNGGPTAEDDRPRRGGRYHQNLSVEEEVAFLAPFIESAQTGGILVVGDIHRALEKRLGRHVALSSTYHLLHRHHWRKLAPDKRHPKSDPQAQEAFKKTPRPSS